MRLLVKNLLFTLLVPGTVAVWVPLQLGAGGGPAGLPARIGGSAALLVGGAIYAWCVWDFARSGRGTPAPIDAPKELVVRGLYRHARNPMYLGVLTLILGWTLLFLSSGLGLYLLGVAACFHAVVRLYEEPHLRRAFGRPYEEYCARVPRWLPRLRRAG